jgi:hypothetical protein
VGGGVGGDHGEDAADLFIFLVDGILKCRVLCVCGHLSCSVRGVVVVILKGSLVEFLDLPPRDSEGRDWEALWVTLEDLFCGLGEAWRGMRAGREIERRHLPVVGIHEDSLDHLKVPRGDRSAVVLLTSGAKVIVSSSLRGNRRGSKRAAIREHHGTIIFVFLRRIHSLSLGGSPGGR